MNYLYHLFSNSDHFVAPEKQFNKWLMKDHAASYVFMQRVVEAWKKSNFVNQYLIYGKVDATLFKWEIVPYQTCSNIITRKIQQLIVLIKAIFGGSVVSEEDCKKQQADYQALLKEQPMVVDKPLDEPNPGNPSCPFCKKDVVDNQSVITGNKVNVFFTRAPIGFGGERLHFLVIPKVHRVAFTDVTQEEYCESMDLTTKLINHFTNSRKTIKGVYLLNKTGVDAGQTVKHWHLHVIFSTSASQDFWGKLTVMKNILVGSSDMEKNEFAERVKVLSKELASINKKD